MNNDYSIYIRDGIISDVEDSEKYYGYLSIVK